MSEQIQLQLAISDIVTVRGRQGDVVFESLNSNSKLLNGRAWHLLVHEHHQNLNTHITFVCLIQSLKAGARLEPTV
eukprot:1462591-Pyramimonas_sp.AAC.2